MGENKIKLKRGDPVLFRRDGRPDSVGELAAPWGSRDAMRIAAPRGMQEYQVCLFEGDTITAAWFLRTRAGRIFERRLTLAGGSE
jgi:hypothetical protein